MEILNNATAFLVSLQYFPPLFRPSPFYLTFWPKKHVFSTCFQWSTFGILNATLWCCIVDYFWKPHRLYCLFVLGWRKIGRSCICPDRVCNLYLVLLCLPGCWQDLLLDLEFVSINLCHYFSSSVFRWEREDAGHRSGLTGLSLSSFFCLLELLRGGQLYAGAFPFFLPNNSKLWLGPAYLSVTSGQTLVSVL